VVDITFGLQVLNVSTSSTTASALVTLGDHLNGISESDSAQWVQHVGFCSLPSNPQQAGTIPTDGTAPPWASTTEVGVFRGGQRDFVFASRDVNSQAAYGNLGPGEFSVYAAGSDGKSQGKVFGKDDGSVTVYTTDDNTSTGSGVYLRVDPSTGLTFVSPWGTMSLGPSGFHVVMSGGSAFHLGGLGAGPTQSYCNINSGTIGLTAPSVTLGIAPIFPLAYGYIPAAAPGIPILGEGVGAVTVNASTSTSVLVSP